jgi:hypothetical protein
MDLLLLLNLCQNTVSVQASIQKEIGNIWQVLFRTWAIKEKAVAELPTTIWTVKPLTRTQFHFMIGAEALEANAPKVWSLSRLGELCHGHPQRRHEKGARMQFRCKILATTNEIVSPIKPYAADNYFDRGSDDSQITG